MAEPILDPSYWKQRLESARRGEIHHAVFRCPLERWRAIEQKHRQILAKNLKEWDSVLDCGCGWGRLLDLMPPTWNGPYLGVDISPDFIHLALTETVSASIRRGQGAAFMVADLRELSKRVSLLPTGFEVMGCDRCRGAGFLGIYSTPTMLEPERCPQCKGTGTWTKHFPPRKWDWAVMVSVRPMVKRNLGGEAWDAMEAEIRKCAEKLLYLEYDPDDEGSVE